MSNEYRDWCGQDCYRMVSLYNSLHSDFTNYTLRIDELEEENAALSKDRDHWKARAETEEHTTAVLWDAERKAEKLAKRVEELEKLADEALFLFSDIRDEWLKESKNICGNYRNKMLEEIIRDMDPRHIIAALDGASTICETAESALQDHPAQEGGEAEKERKDADN